MSRKTVLLFPGQGAHRGRYATALDYSGEVFTEDVELEADVGVDSVKQTELLSQAADRYQLPARPTDFRLSDYSTMGRVADFVFGTLTAPAAMFGGASIPRFWFDQGVARLAISE
jgi:acyl carrier protein